VNWSIRRYDLVGETVCRPRSHFLHVSRHRAAMTWRVP
jgi:hypothetical protein